MKELKEESRGVFLIVAGLSVLLHATFYWVLSLNPPPPSDQFALKEVSFEVIDLPEEPEPEEVEPEVIEDEPAAPNPPPKNAPKQPIDKAPKIKAPPPRDTPQAPPPKPSDEPPPPVRFDNIVLTNEGSKSSWSASAGSGIESKRPLASPMGASNKGSENGVPGGTGTGDGPPLVAFSKLSKSPVPPPNMDRVLERNYPPKAKNQGIEGTVIMRMRIDPDGSPRQLRVLSESVKGSGFAEACRETLAGRKWVSGGLDSQGRPAATIVKYTCTFKIRR